MSTFGRLHHVGIAVNELEPACRNVAALLEGRVIKQGADESFGARWLWIGSPGNPVIELLAPIGDGPIADWLLRRGQGLHHLSFVPDSLDESLAHVHRCGLGVIGENRSHAGYEEFFIAPALTGRALFHSFRELT